MDKMSIPYERFVHCPDHKLLYNFNKYVCKINVTITIKLIVISVVVFDKIVLPPPLPRPLPLLLLPPPRGKAMRVAGAVKKVGAALGAASAGVTLQAVGPALLQAVAALLLVVAEGPDPACDLRTLIALASNASALILLTAARADLVTTF